MAVTELHKTSTLGENHYPASRRYIIDRSTMRTSTIRKMWRDRESEGRVGEDKRRCPEKPYLSSSKCEIIESEDTSRDNSNEIENQCPQNQNQIQNRQPDDNRLHLHRSPSLDFPAKERVRKVFHDWGSKSFEGRTVYTSRMNNCSKAESVEENECKRVRIEIGSEMEQVVDLGVGGKRFKSVLQGPDYKMKKGNLILMLCTITIAISLAESVSEGPKGVEKWFKDLPLKKQKVTKLHFYFHDTFAGPGQSAYPIFASNITSTCKSNFGLAFMFDNPMTVTPDIRSTTIGRGQGFAASASLSETRFLMNMNFVFTQGKFNGSTLQVLGTNPLWNDYRETSVLGGTGAFRLATGIATYKKGNIRFPDLKKETFDLSSSLPSSSLNKPLRLPIFIIQTIAPPPSSSSSFLNIIRSAYTKKRQQIDWGSKKRMKTYSMLPPVGRLGDLKTGVGSVVMLIPLVESVSEEPEGVEKWFKDLPLKKQKVTKLHFYFHDTLAGPGQTGYPVFSSNITSTSISNFGLGFIFDNPMTIGPDRQSMNIGRGQGLASSASLSETRFLMNLNFVFTQGKLNGSTLQVVGTNPNQNEVREMSVVGGTGVFRLASGIAAFRNETSSTLEYDIVVLHY
ncbi:hypothetical protein LXL04_019675 [Taraxacum kok-saghyz]